MKVKSSTIKCVIVLDILEWYNEFGNFVPHRARPSISFQKKKGEAVVTAAACGQMK